MKIFCEILFLYLLFFTVSATTKAQEGINLVPNGSFEVYSQCPYPATLDPMPDNMIELATGWGNPTGFSPDYYNVCVSATNGWGVPQNGRGFQNARTGDAYAGLISAAITSDAREYIQTELTTPLIAGKQYLVTFYVSLAEVCTYASNNIGVYFSNTPVSAANSLVLPYTPQISNNPFTNPLTDMVGWTEVSGTFTALGGEKFMIIGNFNDDASTDTTSTPYLPSPWWVMSYHYIDDISVVCLDCSVGIDETRIENKVSIFPNPATEYLNINFKDIYPTRITLFNNIGICLFFHDNKQADNLLQIDVANYNSGVYFLKIETENDYTIKQFLIIK